MKMRGGRKRQPERRPLGRQRRAAANRPAPSAFSYYASRSERPEAIGRQQPNAVIKRNRILSWRFWLRRSGLLVAVLAALVCTVSILSLSSQPRIVLLSDTGGYAFHDATTYQQAAAVQLRSSIWNKNKITVNTGATAAALRKQFPELSSVTVTLPLIGHRPVYYLRAHVPVFVVQAVNGTYVLDDTGTVLLSAAAVPPRVVAALPIVTDQTGLHVVIGKQAISSQKIAFMQTVVKTLAAKQVHVLALTLPAHAAQELDVHVNGQPYVIKFNMDGKSARQQAGTYLATANTLAEQHVIPSQYIDVRVLGRAYYQ
jgi:hypothetical protein